MTDSVFTSRSHYKKFYPLCTRWNDNDIYGHVNNVAYYAYFDSAVNHYLIEKGGLDIHGGKTVAFVVNSQCHYLAPIAYPDEIEVAVGVKRLGNSSVTYAVAIFKAGQQDAVAYGDFVHVFVQRANNKSVTIPETIRAALMAIQIGS
jgi:acyl-CoA thioester hydrolase